MRALFNATTLHSGGGLQVGVSLISHALRTPAGIEWRFVISPSVAQELNRLGISLPESSVTISSPARDRAARRRLRQLATVSEVDVVLTAFGPAYTHFDTPHVMGVADGWTTHSNWLAYRSLESVQAAAVTTARCVYKGLWYRDANHWIVEAESARRGLGHRLGIPTDQVTVIPNTCSDAFKAASEVRPYPSESAVIRVLTLAYPYPHKDLRLVPELAKQLRQLQPDRRFEFILSAPHDHSAWRSLSRRCVELGVDDIVNTVGRVSVADSVDLYRRADVCLMPTLLETFSATYPEAMAMGLPIVTTDLGFAHDICGDAALYYRARSVSSAASQIADLVGSQALWEKLVAAGSRRFAASPDAAYRYRRVVQTLRQVAGKTTLLPQQQAA